MVAISEQDINNLAVIRKSVKDFLKECSVRYDTEGSMLLDIAPQDYEGAREFFKRCIIRTFDIDQNSNADYIGDICRNNSKLIEDDSFDYVVCTEVLEHTLDPFGATKEIHRILKPKGFVFVTVPFNFRIHGPLPDCWRFTEHGLRALFQYYNILHLDQIETPNRALCPIHYKLVGQKKMDKTS